MAEKLKPIEAPEAEQSFAALSAAVAPAWHQAILRLAHAAERVDKRFAQWGASSMIDGGFVRESRELIKELIDFLDELEPDPDLEPTLGDVCGPVEADECEIEVDTEPSLGSFDRMMNQNRAWARVWNHDVDCELDRSDDEPSLGWTEDGQVGRSDDREGGHV
jgi:hypothetical protein